MTGLGRWAGQGNENDAGSADARSHTEGTGTTSSRTVTLIVNGERCRFASELDRPLLWVLRDDLGLSSPKYGCGAEQCGACSVLVGGAPRPSCRLPLSQLEGEEVVTLEGLLETPEAREVLGALEASNAGQCCYCMPAIALTLVWLVRRRPVAWEEVLRALDDHLCRCGSHPRILRVARALLAEGVPS